VLIERQAAAAALRRRAHSVFNDDQHLVGHEMVRIGPGLQNFIRRMAEEGG
jgi:hypothetical protein